MKQKPSASKPPDRPTRKSRTGRIGGREPDAWTSSLEAQHLFLGQQTQALPDQDLSRLGEFLNLDDQYGAVVGDESRTVGEVDLVPAQAIGYGLQGAGA